MMCFRPSFIINILILLWAPVFLLGQSKPCVIQNKAMRAGEELTYKVYYTLAGAYVGAGEAIFSTSIYAKEKKYFHLKGSGRTYGSYDWFYKVRDLYESVVDSQTLKPVIFRRNIQEGNQKLFQEVYFDRSKLQVTDNGQKKSMSECVLDVLSAIYYARNIDFAKYQVGDKIPIEIYLDGEIHSLYIRYLGKEKISTRHGQYQTIKFKPLLLEGTLFKGGEQMTVWVTNDARRIPVYIDTPILVGHIRVFFIKGKGLIKS
jgi:hypothetical protein